MDNDNDIRSKVKELEEQNRELRRKLAELEELTTTPRRREPVNKWDRLLLMQYLITHRHGTIQAMIQEAMDIENYLKEDM